jgi:hypothetical protein
VPKAGLDESLDTAEGLLFTRPREVEMKRLIMVVSFLFALALPAVALAAPPAWNLTGTYTVNFTCTSGCGETYLHTMTITTSNDSTGAVTGTGSIQGLPGYDWTVTGTISGSDLVLDIEWVSPPEMLAYNPLMLTGTIAASGAMSGTAVDGQARTFTWATTEGAAASILPTASASTDVTLPPTSSHNGSPTNTGAPLMAMLICLIFGALGLTAVAAQRSRTLG